ncbi:MAG: tRNA (cytosine(32)/uridine(32)-2'-O)-methyltransferase TrmJ [Amphritea sp.]|nr:tRNA (cytosine(32)/uridine(32)-2'-O)-methyltransferase TrmJ [Amphritea sp.]MBQ0785255.1 tRNA (cytosine(32)/uridine(32)-2'-O)-methyltransferase TrmJ [Amphritea sp.]
MLKNIRIVLVNTSHPGNIGAAARAMKNMGLSDLCLVEPRKFPHGDADARAAGATDVLENAQVVDNLDQALSDCQLVVGASARSRTIPWPIVNPRELAAIVEPLPEDVRVAVLFGREDRGLTNDELQRCHHHVHIPVNEEFSSLNIAAAVQVITYELRMSKVLGADEARPQWGTEWDVELADNGELERLFDHLEETLTDVEFLDPEKPRNLMPRLRRLFLRALPDKIEVNILRGMLTAIQKCNRR